MSNHRRMSSGISMIFPFDARASCKCFALTDLTVIVNSLPFLSLLVILQLVSREYIKTLSNRKSAPRPMTIAVASLSSVPTNGKPILARCLAWGGNEC